MTLGHYAAKGFDSKWQVQSRCLAKYGTEEEKRQGWLREWKKVPKSPEAEAEHQQYIGSITATSASSESQ